eukprot:TRINITY_DN14896_c0_g1_i1.p1 TRINITY_DN14896_c0_g1~~TRINITY_DN14896_c0_g1_i1.p1  ORF type:complete len:168 (+),score=41.27 TRINITY_DN14896_c0_g1_i1:64-567(+)
MLTSTSRYSRTLIPAWLDGWTWRKARKHVKTYRWDREIVNKKTKKTNKNNSNNISDNNDDNNTNNSNSDRNDDDHFYYPSGPRLCVWRANMFGPEGDWPRVAPTLLPDCSPLALQSLLFGLQPSLKRDSEGNTQIYRRASRASMLSRSRSLLPSLVLHPPRHNFNHT